MSSEATAPSSAGVVAGDAHINFATHEVRSGEAGAREDFETMISQLVAAVRPGVTRRVAANPGDWGIDAFIGDLGGEIAVWQAKYFRHKVSKDHQQQIRDSFDSAMKCATDQDFKIAQWTLCIPSSMDGPTVKWWDGWSKRQRKTGMLIELWDETELRKLLMSADAEPVRRHFYGAVRPGQSLAPVVSLADDDAEQLDSALFVRQLRAADYVEVMASKEQFFNAELMAREIADKGVATEIAALASADAGIRGVWEEHFNEACQLHENPCLPGLHRRVMGTIRTDHATLSAGLPAGPVHTCGLMHRIVDSRRAGWVKHWRDIADEALQSDASSS